MILYDVESFMRHCSRKGLAVKTLNSYEQTLRLFVMWAEEQGVTETEKVRHDHVAQYVDYILNRGKYTVCIKEESWGKNHPEKRPDYGRRVSPTTVNNYLRNMNAFFNWCTVTEQAYLDVNQDNLAEMYRKHSPLSKII